MSDWKHWREVLVILRPVFAIFAALLLACVLMEGCGGTSAKETARLHHVEATRCIADEQEIMQHCTGDHWTQSECLVRLSQERQRCDAALAAICRNGKGCP